MCLATKATCTQVGVIKYQSLSKFMIPGYELHDNEFSSCFNVTES
jgi:hypothetical protein